MTTGILRDTLDLDRGAGGFRRLKAIHSSPSIKWHAMLFPDTKSFSKEVEKKTPQDRRVVLLAEDDVEMRLLLSLVLQRHGYTVIECKDGGDLYAKIRPLLRGKKGAAFDLIISDIRMPGHTGLEIVEDLAGLQGRPPLILITAFGDAATHERSRQLGAAAVLNKPFEIDLFIKVVHDLLVAPKEEGMRENE